MRFCSDSVVYNPFQAVVDFRPISAHLMTNTGEDIRVLWVLFRNLAHEMEGDLAGECVEILFVHEHS